MTINLAGQAKSIVDPFSRSFFNLPADMSNTIRRVPAKAAAPAEPAKKQPAKDVDVEAQTVTDEAQLRYGTSRGKQSVAKVAVAKAAPTPAPLSKAEALHNAVVEAMAQDITDRIQSKANLSHEILNENDTFSATAIYSFAWRMRADGVHDGTPPAPESVTFSKDALNKMFGGKIDLDKPQYVHSAYIVEAHNSSPYPLHFTLDGIQNSAIEREFCNDGTASTMMLLPKSRYDKEIEIYRLKDVDPKHLRTHGNASLEEEVGGAARPQTPQLTGLWPVDMSSFIVV